MPPIKELHSPNFDTRAPDVPLRYIVLHYTGMPDAQSAVDRMMDATAKVSAHYVVDEDGSILKLVDEVHRAWHAGQSFWKGLKDINSASIGIELVNPGHEFGYRPFPVPQIDALAELLENLCARTKLPPHTALLAHSDIAPSRKTDPGELFPWHTLAQKGLGIWPNPTQPAPRDLSEDEATRLLTIIGYDTSAPTEALRAFQRRFFPENLTGTPDPETLRRLNALTRQMDV